MFKNDFQGGNYFEIFNPSVKDPLNIAKVTGSHGIQKIFDKEVKGSIYQLDGSPSTTKISIPKDTKQGLSLIQRCIVFQVNVKPNHEYSMEIGITDLSQNRRNLLFSTSHKELSIQPLSARIPIKSINRSQWINFTFDLASLINEIWRNQTFKSIDSISICANCKLRKIFTLKNMPSLEFGLAIDNSLNNVDFPQGTDAKLQMFNLNETKLNENLENSSNENNKNANSNNAKAQNVFKIAFGSKVPSLSNNQLNQQQQQPNSSFKSSKSNPQLEQSDLYELNLKNTALAPLPMLNNSLNKQKIESHLTDKSNILNEVDTATDSSKDLYSNRSNTKSANAKTTWNQRATLNKSASTSSAKLSSSFSNSSHQNNDNINSNKINPPPNRLKNLNESYTINQNSNNQKSPNSTQLNNSGTLKPLNNNMNNSNLTSNKIPHPPPPQTKPATTSARKLRLSSAVKATSNSNNNNNQINSNRISMNRLDSIGQKTTTLNNYQNGELSSNEEDIHNNSSKTLLEFNIKSQQQPESLSILKNQNYLNDSFSNNELTHSLKLASNDQSMLKNTDIDLDGSSNSIVYSFSSRPKPVNVNNNNNKDTASTSNSNNNSNSKGYDYRKYATSTTNTNNKLSMQSNNSLLLIANSNKLETNKLKDSLNPTNQSILVGKTNEQINYDDVMDSFEARMLQEMKAEMDSNHTSTQNSKKNSNSSDKNTNNSKNNKIISQKNNLSSSPSKSPEKYNAIDQNNNNKSKQIANLINDHNNYKFNQRSPDAEFIESLQREASGIQSPLSDDNNHTTSEKYNFDVMTDSIDDTTTSISRRPSNMKTALDESNNYQDEMNVSLQTNLPAKSINYKDMPLKYSPMFNQQPNMNKLQKMPITEEPVHYDDSQADIDEISDSDEEEVDLLYDSALNCYYDPKTGTYYELNLS